MHIFHVNVLGTFIACVAGVEGEGKGKTRAREVRDPFPPLLRPATQAGTFTVR